MIFGHVLQFVYLCLHCLGRPYWVGAETKQMVSVLLRLVCVGWCDVGSGCACETRFGLIGSLHDQL